MNEEEKQERKRKRLEESRRMYAVEAARQVSGLLRLHEDGRPVDSAAIYRIAHSLKGSAPMFGYAKLGKAAEEMAELWAWTQEGAESEATDPALCVRLSLPLAERMNRLLQDGQEEAEADPLHDDTFRTAAYGRLLIVDDESAVRQTLGGNFREEGYAADEAASVAEARKLLLDNKFDLILLDLIMEPESGYGLFEFLKKDPTLKWVPLIVLSGNEDVADKVRCFRLGTDDYVTKPFHFDELSARVRSLLERTRNLQEMAFKDPLTGVFNRRYFDQQAEMELDRVNRYPAPLSLAFLDIDHFKKVNDSHGHHIGDLVLQGLASFIRRSIRSTDLLARLGGEEFAVLMPNTNAEQAERVIAAILEQVRANPAARHEGVDYRITFSAGIAAYESGVTLTRWMAAADEAMYEAKRQGRNRVLRRELIRQEEARRAPTPGLTVLLADGDPVHCDMLSARLEQLPLTLLIVDNGDAAKRILESRRVDLCIMDAQMPLMDGFDLLEWMNNAMPLRRPKVMLLSLYRKQDMARGFQLGADDYMAKPFSMLELEMRIKRLLSLQP